MGIENLKRWHWCVIGLIVGGAIATIYLAGIPREEKFCERGGPKLFEDALVRHIDSPTQRRVARVHDIVIHPGTEIPGPNGVVKDEVVTYYVDLFKKVYKKDEKRLPEGNFQRILTMQTINDHDRTLVPGNLHTMGVRKYLATLQTKLEEKKALDPDVFTITYKSPWYETPRGAYTIGLGGGFLVIGLVWPTIVSLLVGAGFGRGRSAEVDEYDLSRFKGRGKSKTAKERAAVSQAEKDKLAALEAELERNLMAGAKPRVAKEAEVVAPTAVPVLKGGPLETAKEPEQKAAPAKGFGADQGDYYPTEVHGKKKT